MPKHIWSPQELAILENNREENNFSQLSSLLNLSEKAIQLKLCRLKKHCKPKPRPKWKQPSNTEDLLREKYLTHSLSELSSLLGISNSTVSAAMKSLGLTKIKALDNSFFSSENILSCYWAGFLAADGNVRKQKSCNSYELILFLAEKDINQIIQFKKDIRAYDWNLSYRAESHIKTGKISPQYGVHLTISKQCFTDLATNFSIIPAKSLTLLSPNITRHENKLSFIKGYIDGDGCISKTKDTQKAIVTCLGTFELLSWIKSTLNLKSNPRKISKTDDKNTYVICINTASASAIKASIPYRGLERKWDKIT